MNTKMNLQRIPVDKLKPAKYNPRKDLKPGDPAYEKIKRSLHDFGYVDPVIWNEVTGNIVGGHQRYKVLTAEGATEIDCVVVHIENPQDEKALNIALNKAVGEWEPVALADLLSDLQQSGYDLGATGFDAAEVDDLFSKVHDKDVKDDDCELEPDEVQPFVQPGDVWTLGRHRMVCGDSTNADDVALLMDGVKANLIVTDPPYNVAYESADGKSIQNDSMADEKFYEFLLAAFRNMAAHLAEGGNAYIFHADTEGLNFRRAFKEAGFHISGVCIWVKNSLVLPFFWLPEETLQLRVRRDHVMYDKWEKQGYLMTTEGNVVHYGFIEQFICQLGERYNIREIAYDRWNATMMVQTLQDDGFTMVPFGQGYKDMSPPTKELMRLVLEHKINHGGHPVLRWNMDNAFVRTDPAGNVKIDKEKSTEKVDGAVALVMALDRALKNNHGGSVYDDRGLLFI